jgi:hypothetical protein
MKIKARHRILLSSIVVSHGVLTSGIATATEGSIYGGPIGGSDIRSSYLPAAPGVYVGAKIIRSDADAYFGLNGITYPNGPFATYHGIAGAIGALVRWPGEFLGGAIGSAGGIPISSACLRLNALKGCSKGDADIRADPIIWSRYLGLMGANPPQDTDAPKLPYGLTISSGLNMTIPSGLYETTRLYTPGKGSFIFSPNIGFTYLTGPNLSVGDGTEISAKFYYNIGTYNSATKYDNGNVFSAEYAITERVGRFQFGITGVSARQVSDDYRSGLRVQPDGKRLLINQVGPIVACDLPEIKASFSVKVLFLVSEQYSLGHGQGVIFSFAKKID